MGFLVTGGKVERGLLLGPLGRRIEHSRAVCAGDWHIMQE